VLGHAPFPNSLQPIGLGYFRAKPFSHINTPTISSSLLFVLTPPMKMEKTCSETSAYNIQSPENPTTERIQRTHSLSLHSFTRRRK
jgi:hypothetical protein